MPPFCEIAWQHAWMRTVGRALAVLTVVIAWLGVASAASAHERAVAEIVAPAEGTVVNGDVVEVVLRASGSGSPAEFQLFLDDLPIDGTGQVAGVFTTLRIDAGAELRLIVTLETGGLHTLRLVPAPHETPDPTITRTFTSIAPVETSTVTASASASASAAATPAAPPSRAPLGVGTVLVMLLGLGLLGSGVAAVVYSRYVD